MGCNCKWMEIIVAIVVFVLAIWPELLGENVSKWIIAIAAIVLFVHAMRCKNCGSYKTDMSLKSKSSGKKKK